MERQFDCQFSRHDHHNLEIKFALESPAGQVSGRTDFHLFFPSTVKLRSYTKHDLMLDFHSRVRLSVPFASSRNDTVDEAHRDFEKALDELLKRGSAGEADEFRGVCQRYGAVFGEALKALKTKHCRELLLAHSLFCAPVDQNENLAQLSEEIKGVGELVDRAMRTFTRESVPFAPLVGEYVWYLYVQYLGSLRASFDELTQHPDRYPRERFARGWSALRTALDALSAKAAQEKRFCEVRSELLQDERKRELHLIRISQLKKFFQSNMFVDVSRNQIVKRFSEPVAAIAAASAAVWAAFAKGVEASRHGEVGLESAYLLSLGVAAYVLKDRIKDRGKKFLAQRVARFLPDQVLDLMAQNRRVGRVREWFAIEKPRETGQEIRNLRDKFRVSEAEPHLNEDVLRYSKQFKVRSANPGTGRWAIQESVRINLERYLKHLDDPYKDLMLLDAQGQFARLAAPRVYYIHGILKTTLTGESVSASDPRQESHQQFLRLVRIVMDKRGIQRVETLSQEAHLSSIN